MQTGLFIEGLSRGRRKVAGGWSMGRLVRRWWQWLGAYELGSDEEIRRHTGAR